MVEGNDLYGDGVNIAARLEGIAEPGSIMISGTAYDYVKNKIGVGFTDLGTQTLKNIAESVRVYAVAGTPRVSVATPKVATAKPSIAVLPFVNMSGDPEQQYFSDGITEDIITELSRFRQLRVLAAIRPFGIVRRGLIRFALAANSASAICSRAVCVGLARGFVSRPSLSIPVPEATCGPSDTTATRKTSLPSRTR
jgi:Adenylate and Guanylate cyclase catalytic domain